VLSWSPDAKVEGKIIRGSEMDVMFRFFDFTVNGDTESAARENAATGKGGLRG
jgi:hypothetical protein